MAHSAGFRVHRCLAFVAFVSPLLSCLATAEHTTPTRASKLRASAFVPKHNAEALVAELRQAMNTALGNLRQVKEVHLQRLREKLEPMWRSLPKNEHGLLDRRSLRYAVHRHFLQTYGLAIVGLEPPQINGSHEEVVLLTEFAPSFVRSVLEGKAAKDGFSFEDAVVLCATLEQLIRSGNRALLEVAYRARGKAASAEVDEEELKKIMSSYVLRWLLGQDGADAQEYEANQTLLEASVEHWNAIVEYVHGQVDAFEFEREKVPSELKERESRWNPLSRRFSFVDAEAVVGAITTTFGGYWETECARIKGSLMAMDTKKTGRVKLSHFHGAALAGEWRFSESKEYLRELGALDESSKWHGPSVIITNYMQAASNCIVFQDHYRVCCVNECEAYLSDLEEAIGAPSAPQQVILQHIANMTTSLDDERPRLTKQLVKQLTRIATAHGGEVPLHGRLFSQWLHYVFPHDCPFPHKAGTVKTRTPNEFGHEFMATEEEMVAHTTEELQQRSTDVKPQELDASWMTLWSEEEELLAQNMRLRAPWESTVATPLAGLALLSAVVAFLVLGGRSSGALRLRSSSKDMLPTALPMTGKAHHF